MNKIECMICSNKVSKENIYKHERGNANLTVVGDCVNMIGTIKGNDSWLFIQVNYCPICGKKLRDTK